jgi:hypothetical protein
MISRVERGPQRIIRVIPAIPACPVRPKSGHSANARLYEYTQRSSVTRAEIRQLWRRKHGDDTTIQNIRAACIPAIGPI